MKKILYGLIILFLLVIIALVAKNHLLIIARAQEFPQIIFNEIMYNPQGTDTGHEWVEILNVSTSTVYVLDDKWRFSDGSNHLLTVTEGSNALAARQYAVLADNPGLFLQDHPDYQGILIDTVMSLNNSGDILNLSNDSGLTLFATTTYQIDWGASGDGYTLERLNLTDVWQPSIAMGGTPGTINSHNLPPEEQQNAATSTPVEEENNQQATSSLIVEENNFTTSSPQDIIQATSTVVDLNENTATATVNNLADEELNSEQQNNQIIYSDQIIINEILPNPNGSDAYDEFIELYNRGNQPVDLASWKLQDSSARQFAISSVKYQSTIIPAFGYFVVYSRESGIALNNGGDQIRLYQPGGQLLDQLLYDDDAKSNWAYAKNGGSFAWTLNPTPGNNNVIQSQESTPQSSSTVIYANQPTGQSSAILTAAVGASAAINIDKAKYQGLRINEFLPNPTGADAQEWIEIFNNSNVNLPLSGFRMDDADGGSRPYVFPTSTNIVANGYLLVNKIISKISLNNDQDSARLLWPDSLVLQEVIYDKTKIGQSYNYNESDDEWFWSSSVTPGILNFQPAIDQLDADNEVVVQTDTEEKNYFELSEIQDLLKGQIVKVRGVVIAELGQVYKKSFYLALVDLNNNQVDSGQALEIYTNIPMGLKIKIGDILELSGKISIAKDRVRINLNKDSKLSILDHLNSLEPIIINIQDLQDDLLGGLIQVNGQLVKKQSGKWIVADDNGEVRIDLKEEVKEAAVNLKEGDYVSVTGILVLGTDGYRLFPRTVNDIKMSQVLSASEETATITPEIILSSSPGSNKSRYLFFSGSGLLAIIASVLVKLKFFS